MRVAWVTGARGFLGRHLALELAHRGWSVAGVGHGIWPEAEAAEWGVVQWLNGEIAAGNLEVLASRSGTPEAVFHLAGGSSVGASLESPLEDFERTCGTTARLLAWLRRGAPAARVVAASSAAVYGARHSVPIREDSGLDPFSPYGLHKRMMEDLCLQYARDFGLDARVVRFFSIYGPELRKQLLWDTCSRLAAGTPVLRFAGKGTEQRDWLHVRDAVRWMAEVVAAPPGASRVLNAGTGRGTDVRAIVTRVRDAWGADSPIEFTGEVRSGDPAYLVADPAAMAGAGFTPEVSVHDGIGDYVRWFRSQARSR